MGTEGMRNMRAVAADVAEGFIAVNPLYLKTLSPDEIKILDQFLKKKQNDVKAEAITNNDLSAIRHKNMRLQRLNLALTVIKNYAKAKRLLLDDKDQGTKKRKFQR